MIYNNLEKNEEIIKRTDPAFSINFINGPYLEVNNSLGNNFDVLFIDKKTNVVYYSTNIHNNCWTRSNISYFVDWKIVAKRNDGEIFEFEFDANDKKVFISIESKSLGDTLAWFPQIEEFRKKWNCKVVCSTFHNYLFEDQYPDLEFVLPGSVINGVYAMYKLGLFFDNDDINYKMHKNDPKKLPLVGIATDILGLEYSEVRAIIKKPIVEKKKRVAIGFHSTAQTKYWNNPNGWEELTDYLISIGYEVVIASKEEDGYMGNFYPKGVTKIPEGTIENLIDELNKCEFFIGISSGLSWLAWTINIPVVLISGFTGEELEPSDNVIRIINKSVCNDCWSRHKFDAGDWNWCPDQKGTPWQFICTKSITSKMVIDSMIENNLIVDDFKFNDRSKLGDFLNRLGLINKGVEVGTFKGHFSKSLLEEWKGRLYMVDVWRPLSDEEYDDISNHKNHQDAYSDTMNNISGFEDRAFMLRMKSIYASELFEDESLDFVYIDANHTYDGVKEDIRIWYPKVKKGGLLLGHDYLPNDLYAEDVKDIPLYLFDNAKPEETTYAGMFGVNPAVDEFVENNNYVLHKTDEFLGTWYIIK